MDTHYVTQNEFRAAIDDLTTLALSNGRGLLGEAELESEEFTAIIDYVRRLKSVDTALERNGLYLLFMNVAQMLWIQEADRIPMIPLLGAYDIHGFNELQELMNEVCPLSDLTLTVTIIPLHIVSNDYPTAMYRYKLLRTSGAYIGDYIASLELKIELTLVDEDVTCNVTRTILTATGVQSITHELKCGLYDCIQIIYIVSIDRITEDTNEALSEYRTYFNGSYYIGNSKISEDVYHMPVVEEVSFVEFQAETYTKQQMVDLRDVEIIIDDVVHEEQPSLNDLLVIGLSVYEIINVNAILSTNITHYHEAILSKNAVLFKMLLLQLQWGIYQANSNLVIEGVLAEENATGMTAALIANQTYLSEIASSTITYQNQRFVEDWSTGYQFLPFIPLIFSPVIYKRDFMAEVTGPTDVIVGGGLIEDRSKSVNGRYFIPITTSSYNVIIELSYDQQLTGDTITSDDISWFTGNAFDYSYPTEPGKKNRIGTPFREDKDVEIALEYHEANQTLLIENVWIRIPGAELHTIDQLGYISFELAWRGQTIAVEHSTTLSSANLVTEEGSHYYVGCAINKEMTYEPISDQKFSLVPLQTYHIKERDEFIEIGKSHALSISEFTQDTGGSLDVFVTWNANSPISWQVYLSIDTNTFQKMLIGSLGTFTSSWKLITGVWSFDQMTHVKNSVASVQRQRAVGASINAIAFLIKFDFEARVPVAPAINTLRYYGNQYINDLDIKVNVLADQVTSILDRLSSIEERLDTLEAQVEALIASMQTPWWQVIVDTLIDIGVGLLTAGVGLVAVKAIKGVITMITKAVGYVNRIASQIVTTLGRQGGLIKHISSEMTFETCAAVQQTFKTLAMRSGGKTAIWRDKIKGLSPPVFKQTGNDGKGLERIIDIDVGEKLAHTIDVKTNGKIVSVGDLKLRDIQDTFVTESTISTETVLPKISAHYEPLGVLPAPLAKRLHNITTSGSTRAKYAYDSTQISIRQPSHAFVVVTDYERMDGKSYLTKTVVGVGEMNTDGWKGLTPGGSSVGIGGIKIRYRREYNDTNGKAHFALVKHEDSTYTVEEIQNMYKTFFRKIDHLEDTEEMWRLLAKATDKKIYKSDILGETYIPDTSTVEMLKYMAKNGPSIRYNLMHNNCQSVVSDIIRMIQGKEVSNSWNLESQRRLWAAQIAYLQKVLDIGESEARNAHRYKPRNSNLQRARELSNGSRRTFRV